MCTQDVSKKVSGSNGIPAERSTRSKSNKDHAIKSKAKLKGAFSLIGLNNDTFKSKGKALGEYKQEDVAC
jgi:alpha-1,4-galacturonosyltransferase